MVVTGVHHGPKARAVTGAHDRLGNLWVAIIIAQGGGTCDVHHGQKGGTSGCPPWAMGDSSGCPPWAKGGFSGCPSWSMGDKSGCRVAAVAHHGL